MAESESRVQIVPGATTTAGTYVVSNEDHTLGNALRYTIMRK